MTSFNVMAGGRAQVLVDEQQFQQLQAEAGRRGIELERLKAAMETLSAFNTPARFFAASMALCNEIASRWNAQRVSIGFLKARYVRVTSLSHTEKITRTMQIVLDIESAMEECLDQDVEIVFPPPKDASFVYRATENLAGRHGPNAVLSMPLRRERTHLKERNDERFGNVVAVMTLERKFDKPFTLQEIETLRLTADLFTARLYDLYENDRWLGAKALRSVRRTLAWAVGAKHTWAKAAAIAVAGFLAFAFLVKGEFRVEAPFTVEARVAYTLSAPFDGYLKTVNVDPGDLVFTPESGAPFDDLNSLCPLAPVLPIKRPPSVLASLETAQLLEHRRGKEADLARANADIKIKRSEQKWGELAIAESDAMRAQADIDYDTWQIEHAAIAAPVDGVVFQGDLRTKLGAPLHAGDLLYVVGQSDLRAEMDVSEDQILDVKIGRPGVFRTTAYPDRPLPFKVDRITPYATVVNGKNVFKVRGEFAPGTDTHWLRPDVAGLAKVDVRQESYAWIWTHRMINWVRMKLWM
jgi:hypothetical protein